MIDIRSQIQNVVQNFAVSADVTNEVQLLAKDFKAFEALVVVLNCMVSSFFTVLVLRYWALSRKLSQIMNP